MCEHVESMAQIHSQRLHVIDGLDALRAYLPDWARLSEGSMSHGLAAPRAVPYLDLMRATPSWEANDDHRVDASIRGLIDESVYELSAKMPLCRAVLMCRYRNIRGPAVYRSGRLYELTRGEIEDLADASEIALVPIVRRKGVLL